MKTTKKAQPAARKAGRPAKPDDAAERQVIGARLQPEIYQRLVAAAAANRNSISTEVERRLERSFEEVPSGDDFPRQLADAFEGAWMKPQIPIEEWTKDPLAYHGAFMRAFEVMLAGYPDPRIEWFHLLLYAIRSRLEERLLVVTPDETRTLPGLDWRSRPSSPATNEKKDENWMRRSPPPPTREKDEG